MGQGIKTCQPQPVPNIQEEGGIEEVGFTQKRNIKIRGQKKVIDRSPPLTNVPVEEGESFKGDLGGGQ